MATFLLLHLHQTFYQVNVFTSLLNYSARWLWIALSEESNLLRVFLGWRRKQSLLPKCRESLEEWWTKSKKVAYVRDLQSSFFPYCRSLSFTSTKTRRKICLLPLALQLFISFGQLKNSFSCFRIHSSLTPNQAKF
jgi:hypothetical protein